MLSLETLFTSLIIDSHKGGYVTIFDFSGAYPNIDMTKEKFTSIRIEGEFVDIMCEVNLDKKNMCMWRMA